jgi:HNH endonuclease
MPAARPVLERFWEKVNKTDTCWLWLGSVGSHGYGQISHNLRMRTAHTFSYETFVGKIPKGLWVLHRCDVRSCVNPQHLFLGTRADNIADMIQKGRSWAQTSREAVVANGHRNRHFLPVLFGEKNYNAKLTHDKVRSIRQLWTAGAVSKTALGKRFGVSRTAISYVVDGKRWKDV